MQTNELGTELLKHYAGSLSYGTNLPTSDVDIRGIFVAPKVRTVTPFFPIREYDIPNAEDGKMFELSNYMELYLKGNPNILESLWVDESDVISKSELLQPLIDVRGDLLSSKVAYTFSGYAVSQLKRIKGHDKWITNPQPVDPPRHRDFIKFVQNFSGLKVMPRDFSLDNCEGLGLVHYGGDIFGLVDGEGSKVLCSKGDFNISAKQTGGTISIKSPLFIIRYLAEDFKGALEKHRNYWIWKNNRNAKRSELEEKFGYDSKHAMHLVRLLRMGEEVLTGKGVIVKRPDAKELLDIRDGKWTLEELIDYAEDKDEYIRGELYKNTSLPKKPNIRLGAKVLMEIQDNCWRK